ncbi:MAG: FAD-dependent oxidoreductase [Xanthobacteraceae bacterium]
MNAVTFDSVGEWNAQVPLLIVGAGAAGICAALAAKESGVDAVVIERDSVPSGSTGLSAGLIPAADTRFQRAKGIADSPERFAADIQGKANGEAPPALVEAVARGSAPLIEWLTDRHALPFELVENFNYPGHSALRMHGLPSRTGRELIDRLRNAAELSEIVLLTGSTTDQIFAESDGRVRGVEIVRSDGTQERIGCEALILACNGYGGSPELVRRFIPEMADALYFGHSGNRGDAVLWGEALGAELACLGAYQGHGSVATPHNILITWAVIMEGGIQINAQGQRFSNETRGYSEQAAQVLRQPGGIAWDVFDARIAAVARQFEDFQIAERIGAILMAESVDELAANMRVPTEVFAEEWRNVETLKKGGELDRYGRRFSVEQHLMPPFCAVKVTGALFHTQGGLVVDATGRVKRKDGNLFPNLFAAGGAAVGISGTTAAGYLSGNGLLTATVLGRFTGQAAAALVSHQTRS